MWGFELTVMMVMIAINSVFAAYEISLASISLGRLESLVTRGLTGAASAVRMKTRMEASLAVVQLGITLVGVIAAATGGAGAEESIEPYLSSLGIANFYSVFMAIVLVVIPLTIVTIVFGELIPKVFALRNNERVCLTLSPAMEWFSRSVWPAVWMLETSVSLIMKFFSRRGDSLNPDQEKAEEAALQELRAVAAIARTSRLIGIREEAIINNAARLTRTLVRNVMLPVRYVSMLNVNDSLAQCLIAAHLNMHTRFPVAEKVNDP
jgi:putative hemolysin